MRIRISILAALLPGLLFTGCRPKTMEPASSDAPWEMGPFTKVDSLNPILEPDSTRSFFCPMRKQTVAWEARNVLNPAAVMKDGKIYLLYRAQDRIGILSGTSRLGLAVSADGLHFDRQTAPVFYPDMDSMTVFEWEGGVEDPRLVQAPDSSYLLTYTAWDGKTARLAIARSKDLLHWEKKGLVLSGKYQDLWSKSGAIVCRREGTEMIATKINGKYWMYWGDTNLYLCTSDDLIHWQPVEEPDGRLKIFMAPRKGKFDSDLVEAGPPPVITENGILLLYNGRNAGPDKDPRIPEGTYSSGQVIISKDDPEMILKRSDSCFFKPEKSYEIHGEVGNVCFIEGWVPFNGKWFLYYGTADSRIGVAVCEEK